MIDKRFGIMSSIPTHIWYPFLSSMTISITRDTVIDVIGVLMNDKWRWLAMMMHDARHVLDAWPNGWNWNHHNGIQDMQYVTWNWCQCVDVSAKANHYICGVY